MLMASTQKRVTFCVEQKYWRSVFICFPKQNTGSRSATLSLASFRWIRNVRHAMESVHQTTSENSTILITVNWLISNCRWLAFRCGYRFQHSQRDNIGVAQCPIMPFSVVFIQNMADGECEWAQQMKIKFMGRSKLTCNHRHKRRATSWAHT